MNKIVLSLTALVFVAVVVPSAMAAAVSLPKGYEKWEKSKQKLVTDKSSLFYGSHYIYVDQKAMSAYKKGGGYPEGSRFVVVNFNIREEGGKPVQGKKSMIVLMKKDKRFKETGGWQFAGFSPDGKLSKLDPVKNCYECHLKDARETDLIISKYADFK